MKQQELLLQAVDKNELMQKLKDLHFLVPRRDQGRNKKHVEKHSVFQFFKLMAQNDKLLYPFALFYRDKPDFVASISNLNIGIEVVEAVPQNKALEQASSAILPKRKTWGRLYCINERNMTRNEIENEIKNEIKIPEHVKMGEIIMSDKVFGRSFLDDEIEKNWVQAIVSFVGKKRDVLNKEDFQKYEKNWLLIYDNWPSPALNYDEALPFLIKEISAQQTRKQDFHSIFLIDEYRIIEINL